MLEDTIFNVLNAYMETNNLATPVVPVGPSADTAYSILNTQPIPSIVVLRHSTAPELDLSGTVVCELIDMEIISLGNSFQESTFYAAIVKTLFNNQTYDSYQFSFFNEQTIPTTFGIAQYWQVFFAAID